MKQVILGHAHPGGQIMAADSAAAVEALSDFVHRCRPMVLTGAGISVDSGIPDYRGPQTRHIERRPMRDEEFRSSAASRQRYWARASKGYQQIAAAQPNACHLATSALEARGLITGLVTQNVDGLHIAAGSRSCIELHGSLHRVACLGCAEVFTRQQVQQQIMLDNPGWLAAVASFAPDGDAVLGDEAWQHFVAPRCERCSADLMPDVVFFGGSVPKTRLESAMALLSASRGLLVLGSSLTVYSGYRFVRMAERLGAEIAILTLGTTRGHAHAHLAIDGWLGEIWPEVERRLST